MLRPATFLAALLATSTFLFGHAAAAADACASGSDAGDAPALAAALSHGSACAGGMDALDAADWYFVDEPLDSAFVSINVEVCPSAGFDADLYVYYDNLGSLTLVTGPGALQGASGNLAGECDSVSASTQTIQGELAPGGRWYVEVVNFDASSGTYALTIE